MMRLRKAIHSLAHILRGVARVCGDLSSLTTEKGFRLGVNCELVQNGLDTLESTDLSLIHISEPTRRLMASRMPSSA